MEYAEIAWGTINGIAAGIVKATTGFGKNSSSEKFSLSEYLYSVLRGAIIGGLGGAIGMSPDVAANMLIIVGVDEVIMNIGKMAAAWYSRVLEKANEIISSLFPKKKVKK